MGKKQMQQVHKATSPITKETWSWKVLPMTQGRAIYKGLHWLNCGNFQNYNLVSRTNLFSKFWSPYPHSLFRDSLTVSIYCRALILWQETSKKGPMHNSPAWVWAYFRASTMLLIISGNNDSSNKKSPYSKRQFSLSLRSPKLEMTSILANDF